ncbi:hypothetical protein G5V59_21995 [Nocardioides sp. W3-2-3]|uniref:hypothetical protein n=1 Tax=Nocardioides convexus TaxID=2712224 RepID=UPI0024183693|nr:hypothetical protein [Nocardioides convexus]NHA01564.1 hypothetical protein [Nocardioides convexus]
MPAPTARWSVPGSLTEAGAAGLFTFEGPHDVFLPLAAVAGQVDADLMTNVAIAMPRSPMHLAHTAWDLQAHDGRQVPARAGLPDPPPHREEVRHHLVPACRPHARDRQRRARHPGLLAGRHPAGLPRRAQHPHPDAADLRPRPEPVRPAPGPARRAGPADDAHRRRGRRRAAGHALPQPPPLPRAHPAGGRRGPVPGRSPRRGLRGLPAGDRRDGSHRGGA